VGEGSSNSRGNSTMKLKYIIINPIYSFTDKLHCLINTVTALFKLLTDCFIKVSRSFMTGGGGEGDHMSLHSPLDPHLP